MEEDSPLRINEPDFVLCAEEFDAVLATLNDIRQRFDAGPYEYRELGLWREETACGLVWSLDIPLTNGLMLRVYPRSPLLEQLVAYGYRRRN